MRMKEQIINLIKEIGFFAIYGFWKIIYIVSMLFPIIENRIFVNCFDGKGFGDNPKYIIEELLRKDSDFTIYWLCTEKNKQYNDNVIYVKPMSLKAIYFQSTSRIWISTVRMPYYSIKRPIQTYIQTWHGGLRLKKIEQESKSTLSKRYIRTAKHDSSMIDYYISSSEDCTDLFKNHFWYVKGAIKEFGSPRNDVFFNNNTDEIEQIKRKLFLQGKRIVTYAPTFRNSGSFTPYSIDIQRTLNVLERKFGGDWIFLIRLHPRLALKSQDYITYSERVVNGSMISDPQEVLKITDILISDYSSVMTDFMFSRKPVFIFATDIREYVKERDFHIKLTDLPFPISENNDQLYENIINFNEEIYVGKLSVFLNSIRSFDVGDASVKAADLIMNCVKGDNK